MGQVDIGIKEKILIRIPPFVEFAMRCSKRIFELSVASSAGRFNRFGGEEFAGLPSIRRGAAERLKACLSELGIRSGDILMVHSDGMAIKRMGWDYPDLIDFLEEYLGGKGTLAMPTHPKLFNAEGKEVYNVQRSPSTMGLLTEIFRRRKTTVRSKYPRAAVAASGLYAKELVSGHERSFAPHDEFSPYAKLAESGGKVLCIGVPLDRMSIIHVAEDVMREHMPFHDFYKEELILMCDENREISVKVHERADWLWYYLSKYRWTYDMYRLGMAEVRAVSQVYLRSAEAKKTVDWMKKDILDGKTIYPLAEMNRWFRH